MKKKLLYLIIISTIVRAFLATFLELGNDEVYYRIFGLFPHWSYFDHSPMVAWLVWLTTLGASDVSEFFVRLGPIVIGAVNTYIVYSITNKIANERAAFFASLLYTGSIYCSVIVGTFIMPDTPMSLFWLLTLNVLISFLPPETKFSHKKMLLTGLLIGLAMLSKYTGAYLWSAIGIYILIFNRKIFAKWSLYLSAAISFVVFLPVILWNVEYDFISFTFHSERIEAQNSINLLYFGRELLGSIFYNNPINFVVVILALFGIKDLSRGLSRSRIWFLVIFSVPMILMFLSISLMRETLPHWSAPAYFALIVLAGVYLSQKKWGQKVAFSSPLFLVVILVLGFVQIKTGAIRLDDSDNYNLGKHDFTLDMYGWEQGGQKFNQLRLNDTIMPKDAVLFNFTWDAAAHIDNYFALPYGLQTVAIGELESTHYWEWINRKRDCLNTGDSLYLIVSSRLTLDPKEIYGDQFEEIMPADTIKIDRLGKHTMNFYVYRMLGLKPTSHALLPLHDVLKRR